MNKKIKFWNCSNPVKTSSQLVKSEIGPTKCIAKKFTTSINPCKWRTCPKWCRCHLQRQ